MPGHALALNNYALLLLRGYGTDQDVPLAEKYLKQAAHNGSTVAAKNLAQLYRRGEYLAQNFPQALKYFRMAPEENESKIWLAILWTPVWSEGLKNSLGRPNK